MANVLGNIIKKGKAGVELFIDGVKKTNYKRCRAYNTLTTTVSANYTNTITMNKNFNAFVAYDSGSSKTCIFSYPATYRSGSSYMTVVSRYDGSECYSMFQSAISGAYGFVYFNGETHALGSSWHKKITGVPTNNASYTTASTLPFTIDSSAKIIVYNGAIHVLGCGNNALSHYKYNGSSWSYVSTIPYKLEGSAIVIANGINILGGYSNETGHYRWNGTNWINESTLPYECYNANAVYFNNAIHLIGGAKSNKHSIYTISGKEWSILNNIPFSTCNLAIPYNSQIFINSGQQCAYRNYYLRAVLD